MSPSDDVTRQTRAMPTPTKWGAVIATALAPSIWGTTYFITSEWLPPGRPLFAGALRAVPAGLLLLAVAPTRRTGLPFAKIAVLAGMNIGLFFTLLFIGAYRLPGGVASTVTSFQPLYVAALSALVIGDRISARTLIAGMCGIVGVALLVLRGSIALDGWGLAAAITSTLCSGSGIVLSKRWASDVPPMTLAGWQLGLGGLMLVPVMLVVEGVPGELTAQNVGGLVYLATIGGAVAYFLWFSGIRKLPPTQISFLTFLTPVVATAIGWLALDQGLTLLQVLGALIVLSAAVVSQRPASPSATVPAVSAPDLIADPVPPPRPRP